MTICPSHRAKLGLGWTRGSSDRGIGKRDSQIILKRTGVFLQVGSGELTFCTFFYSRSNIKINISRARMGNTKTLGLAEMEIKVNIVLNETQF